jgi:hypothetical protein
MKTSNELSKKAMTALVMVLLVAAGARMVWELLVPLVPGLIVLAMFGVVFAVVFGQFRR